MPNFTLTLAQVLEYTGGTREIADDGISRLTGGNLGLDYYPEWKEGYRGILNGMIFDHYMNQEIAHESVDLFQKAMRTMMNEEMPYYNSLFETTELKHDPMQTINIKNLGSAFTVSTSANEASGNTAADNDSTAKVLNTDYPQTFITADGQYGTSGSGTQSTSGATGSSEESSNSNTESEQSTDSSTVGYQGLPGDLLTNYRNSLINVNMMVIRMLDPLFMGIWATPDPFTRRQNGF